MNFRRPRTRDDAWIDLAPLIDVVFLLLIFFMTSTTFVRESRLRIDLPDIDSAPTQADRPAIELQIDAAGRYAIDGRALAGANRDSLSAALRAARDGEGRRHLVIVADAETTHQAVVRALEAAAAAGIVDVDIATEVVDVAR